METIPPCARRRLQTFASLHAHLPIPGQFFLRVLGWTQLLLLSLQQLLQDCCRLPQKLLLIYAFDPRCLLFHPRFSPPLPQTSILPMPLLETASPFHHSSACVLSQRRYQTCLCISSCTSSLYSRPIPLARCTSSLFFSHFCPVCCFLAVFTFVESLLHPSSLFHLNFLLRHPFHHLRP